LGLIPLPPDKLEGNTVLNLTDQSDLITQRSDKSALVGCFFSGMLDMTRAPQPRGRGAGERLSATGRLGSAAADDLSMMGRSTIASAYLYAAAPKEKHQLFVVLYVSPAVLVSRLAPVGVRARPSPGLAAIL